MLWGGKRGAGNADAGCSAGKSSLQQWQTLRCVLVKRPLPPHSLLASCLMPGDARRHGGQDEGVWGWHACVTRPVQIGVGVAEMSRGSSSCARPWAASLTPQWACGPSLPHGVASFPWPPSLSVLLHVFQNCPGPCMPWREINFPCNTHREIHVQSMFFWCQKKNNKWLGRSENMFPD